MKPVEISTAGTIILIIIGKAVSITKYAGIPRRLAAYIATIIEKTVTICIKISLWIFIVAKVDTLTRVIRIFIDAELKASTCC